MMQVSEHAKVTPTVQLQPPHGAEDCCLCSL